MPLIPRHRWTWGLITALWLCSATAVAVPQTKLWVVVFSSEGSSPLAGVQVRAGSLGALTNRRGAAALTLPGDVTEVTVVITQDDGRRFKRARVRLRPDHETEVLVTVPGDSHPGGRRPENASFAVEMPKPAQISAAGKTRDVARGAGQISGVARDGRSGRSLAGASVYVRGLDVETRTDRRGRFKMTLPVGVWDLMVVRRGFAPQQHRAVPVKRGKTTTVAVVLNPAGLELAGFVVSAPRIVGNTAALLESRRNASEVADVLGAEQMARSGDSDAAGALSRVTGVTLVGGRFVYVRGLGERYGATQLDGSTLPSPEPERRVVPLDMFPVGVLERIVVQKTWSPNRPGQFGGGAVGLYTRSNPDRFTAKVGFSLGWRFGTTMELAERGRDGSTDWLGVDDATRSLHPEVEDASSKAPLLEADMFGSGGYSAKTLERLGELARGDWQTQQAMTPLDTGLSASVGNRWRLFGGEGGWLLAINWGDSWQRQTRQLDILTVGQGDKTEVAHSYEFNGVMREVNFGGMFTSSLKFGDRHRYKMTLLAGRMTEGETRSYEGYNRDVDASIRVTRHRWIERMLQTMMLSGEHKLGLKTAPGRKSATLRWRYAASLATRLEPDRRSIRYDNEPGTDIWLLSDRPEGNRRTFSTLDDVNHDLGLDLVLPLSRLKGKGGDAALQRSLSFGALGVFKQRQVDTRRYRFLHKGPISRDTDLLAKSPGEIFAPENISPQGFQLSETTLASDNYTGTFQLGALYGQVKWPVTPTLRVSGGARLEAARLALRTFVPFDPDANAVEAAVPGLDLLLGANATWRFMAKQQLRFGVSQTVSRPDLRELSPATFNEVTGGRLVFGNPDLEQARLTHADLRWEWFPSRGQVFSLSAFYKHFSKPVETIVVPSAQLSVTFANAKAAQDVGLEMEWRTKLGRVHRWLRDIYIAGNAAWIWSRIELPGGQTIQTSKVRPLQGQSPWVLNLQAGWDDPVRKMRVGLVYNAAGPRIAEVGALGAPDVYAEPVHRLDLVSSWNVRGGWTVGLKAQNLLDAAIERTQGGRVIDTWRRGVRVSASVSKSF